MAVTIYVENINQVLMALVLALTSIKLLLEISSGGQPKRAEEVMQSPKGRLSQKQSASGTGSQCLEQLTFRVSPKVATLSAESCYA